VAELVMAGILSRYVIGRVLLGILMVSLLLVGIYSLIELIREARGLGGGYGAVQMLWYLAQTTPRRLYDIFPFAALIGTLLGLGGLAGGNELVAMRAAGFDRGQLVMRVLAAVMLCLLALLMLAELAIPGLESSARADRQQARSGQVFLGQHGNLWLRDGAQVIQVGYSAWLADERLEFGDLVIYTLDDAMRPQAITTAERGSHEQGQWHLYQASRRSLEPGQPVVREARLSMESDLGPALFAATVSRPRLLSMPDLLRMRAFLERNGLDAERYIQAFWGRLFFPVNVLAMVLIGLPFVFRNQRSSGRGLNLFAGVALGLAYFIVTRLVQGISMMMPLPVWLSSLLPALLIVGLAGLLLRRL
jgi:lipopolysaccharide export system permease protein